MLEMGNKDIVFKDILQPIHLATNKPKPVYKYFLAR